MTAQQQMIGWLCFAACLLQACGGEKDPDRWLEVVHKASGRCSIHNDSPREEFFVLQKGKEPLPVTIQIEQSVVRCPVWVMAGRYTAMHGTTTLALDDSGIVRFSSFCVNMDTMENACAGKVTVYRENDVGGTVRWGARDSIPVVDRNFNNSCSFFYGIHSHNNRSDRKQRITAEVKNTGTCILKAWIVIHPAGSTLPDTLKAAPGITGGNSWEIPPNSVAIVYAGCVDNEMPGTNCQGNVKLWLR